MKNNSAYSTLADWFEYLNDDCDYENWSQYLLASISGYFGESKTLVTGLDVGCGSGILGITAKKLGANRVIMTDLDECAVTATERNVKLNNVENCEVYLKNLLDDNTVKGDVIAINIMAEVLIAFAPYIGGNLKKNGIIILSGILADRLEKVKNAYTGAGFSVVEDKIKGEWSALVVKGN